MRGKHEVVLLGSEYLHVGSVRNCQVRFHRNPEQCNVFPIVDADEVRERLVRPAANIEAYPSRVGDKLPHDLSGFSSLRILPLPHLDVPYVESTAHCASDNELVHTRKFRCSM